MWPSDLELVACPIRGWQLLMKNQPQQANCERMKKKLWPHEGRKLQIKEFQSSDIQREEEQQAGRGEEFSKKTGSPRNKEREAKPGAEEQETGNRSNRNRRKSFLILMFYCLKFEHFNSVIVNMPQTQCAVTQTNSLLIDLYFKCHFVGRSCV